MANHLNQHAAELVQQFKRKASVKLTGSDEELLTQLLNAALASEVQRATDKMDAVIKELRRDITKPELGL